MLSPSAHGDKPACGIDHNPRICQDATSRAFSQNRFTSFSWQRLPAEAVSLHELLQIEARRRSAPISGDILPTTRSFQEQVAQQRS